MVWSSSRVAVFVVALAMSGCAEYVTEVDQGTACAAFEPDGDQFAVEVGISSPCVGSGVRNVEHTCEVVLEGRTLQVTSELSYDMPLQVKSDCGGARPTSCELDGLVDPGTYTVRFAGDEQSDEVADGNARICAGQ